MSVFLHLIHQHSVVGKIGKTIRTFNQGIRFMDLIENLKRNNLLKVISLVWVPEGWVYFYIL